MALWIASRLMCCEQHIKVFVWTYVFICLGWFLGAKLLDCVVSLGLMLLDTVVPTRLHHFMFLGPKVKFLVSADSRQHSVFLIVAILAKCDFNSHCPDECVIPAFSAALFLIRSRPVWILMWPRLSWVIPALQLAGFPFDFYVSQLNFDVSTDGSLWFSHLGCIVLLECVG